MAFSVSRLYLIIDVLKPRLRAEFMPRVGARCTSTEADDENEKRNGQSKDGYEQMHGLKLRSWRWLPDPIDKEAAEGHSK